MVKYGQDEIVFTRTVIQQTKGYLTIRKWLKAGLHNWHKEVKSLTEGKSGNIDKVKKDLVPKELE